MSATATEGLGTRLVRVAREATHRELHRGSTEFKSAGEYFQAVAAASRTEGIPVRDPRLDIKNAAPSTAGNENIGADGGFAVPPEMADAIARKISGTDSLLAACDVRTITGGSLWIPKDETAPWQTDTGVRVAWDDELEQLTQTIPHLTGSKLRPDKVTALVPVSDELLDDSTALAEHIMARAPEAIDFAVELAIVAGSGIGRPKGILASTGTVVVAEESGQTAGTIVHQNIVKMWNRLTPAARKRAIWLVHPDADLMLQSLQFPVTTGGAAGAPLYAPPSTLAPFGTLLGRPIRLTEACNALGTQGDIILADMSAYLVARRTLRQDMSIHLWFDYDITAFRFVLRIAGQPWSDKLVPSLNGGVSRGFFSTLATRS